MPKKLVEKFKNFWGVEIEDDVLSEDENGMEMENTNDYRPTSFSQENTHIFPTNTKNKVVNIHNNASIKIEVFQPKNFEEALEIVECLRSKRPVVVNLELSEAELARKIFDFLSGALCAIDGKAEKISKGIFLMAPNNVQIKGAIEQREYAPSATTNDTIFNFEE